MKLRTLVAALLCVALNYAPALGQTTILPPGETCFSATAGLNGMVGLLGTITGGSGGTSGTFGGVALTGGSGSGATANITVSGGAVTAVTILNPGTQYVVGDVLSAAAANIGNVTGFSVPVSSVNINNNLAGGSVDFYVPNTLTRKTTWKNSTQTIVNTNPVVLDANGCAIIYGLGSYRQIVKDRLGNTVYDQLTASTAALSTNPASSGAGDFLAIGTVIPIAGFTAPTNYVLAFGQAISRSTFPDALTALTISSSASCINGNTTVSGLSDTSQMRVGAAIEGSCLTPGTTIATIAGPTSVTVSVAAATTATTTVRVFNWGNGNGSTTFNVPDLRGRVLGGPDSMGGVAANRLTSTYYGASAATPGVASSSPSGQSQTIAQANLPNPTLTTTIASGQGAHTHSVARSANNDIVGFITQDGGGSGAPVGVGYNTGSDLAMVAASNTLPAMTGTTPLGGSSTPFSIVQPTLTINFAVKVSNGTLPTVGVLSLGGMTGDILCGTGLLCSGQTISVTGTPTSSLIVGTTAVLSGTPSTVLTNNSGVLGNKFVAGICAEDYAGVDPTGVSDSSTGLNNALAAASPNGVVNLCTASGRYLVSGADIVIPQGVTLKGPGFTAGTNGLYDSTFYSSIGGVILLSSSHTINMGPTTTLRDLYVLQSGLSFPQVNSSAYAGTAITADIDLAPTPGLGRTDVTVHNVLVVGFNKAFYGHFVPRLILENVQTDAVNGFDINIAGDPAKIIHSECWPFGTAAGGGGNAASRRAGFCAKLRSNADAAKIVDSLSFGYAQGFYISDANGVQIINTGADDFDDGTQTSVGFVVDGQSGYALLDGVQSVGHSVGVQVNTFNSTDVVSIVGGYLGAGNKTAGVNINKGTVLVNGSTFFMPNTAQAFLLNGAGDEVLAVTSSIFTGGTGSVVNNSSNSPSVYVDNSNNFTGSATLPVVSAAGIPSVASASTLAVPKAGSIFQITGTTGITTISGGWPGRVVTLNFSGILTVTSGASLRLNGNLTTAANTAITLRALSDTVWAEVGRNTGGGSGSAITALTGDVTATGPGSVAATLATVNSNVGSFGSATQVGTFTVNGKGLITAAGNTTVTPAIGSVTGLGTGIATALAVNVGSAGAPVLFNGAGGTPSSITLTNATGLPLTGLATQAANTFVANVSGSTAAPTAASLPSCSATNSALIYTSGTGLSCKTNVPVLNGTNTFTGAQTITNNLFVSGTSPGMGVAINGNEFVAIVLSSPTFTTGTFAGLDGIGNFVFNNRENKSIAFSTNNTLRMTLTASGAVFFNTGAPVILQDTTASTSSSTGSLTTSGGAGIAGALWTGTYVSTTPTTVATSGTSCSIKGARWFVTDNATALSFGAVITSGGSIQTPIYCDGTVWRQGALEPANDNIGLRKVA